MQNFPSVILHRHKTSAVKRFHPWVFSGAIKTKDDGIAEGDIVEVVSESGEFLALGHYATGSIAIRIFSFEKIAPLQNLWNAKFENAYALRKKIGLTESETTNGYRLINAEGDGMPGLIVDWYNGTAIVQCHSTGMNMSKQMFVEAIQKVASDKLKAVFDKSNPVFQNSNDGYLFSNSSPDDSGVILENGNSFTVNWKEGQKTGFFLDQRDNRALLAGYAAGRKVLNTFCYSGGFSVYAAKAGASLIHSVDSSAKAMEWTNENMALNNFTTAHQTFTADVFEFLKASEEMYDVIILDPPAFAKNISTRHHAIQAYTRLNLAAFKKINRGGIVFTFSCSQAVSPEMFNGAVTSAAIDSGKNIRVLHHLSQPADHPVSIFHPEGLYLKGLVLLVG